MKATILTFNFNEYDILRTHFLSPLYNYIYVTDKNIDLPGWTVIQDKDLLSMEPWEASAYVRYHPFKYTNDENVLVIDGSITVEKNIKDLIDMWLLSGFELGLMLTYQPSCRKRISDWNVRKRLSQEETNALSLWMTKLGYNDYIGCLANAVKMLKNTEKIQEYNELCWNTLHNILPNKTIRLDEIISTIILEKYFNNLKFLAFPICTINETGLKYHYHNSNTEKILRYKPIKIISQNKNANIKYIGHEYNRQYEYKTEAMCLTRYFTEQGLREWLDYHLNLGFDHIHIFDNESEYPCEKICEEYKDKVSYELIKGNAKHYKIFDDYINSDKCKAEWVIPIDDDEYFELNKDICNNISECIDWYKNKFPYEHMFAIRWKHLFPKKFHTECTGSVLEYCTEENHKLASSFQKMGDRGIKTFVHRYGKVHYETTEENPSGGHVPKHSACTGAMLYNSERIKTCSCRNLIQDENEPARLIHCRYKGYNWYKQKNQNIVKNNLCLDNTSGLIYTRNYKFNEILDTLE